MSTVASVLGASQLRAQLDLTWCLPSEVSRVPGRCLAAKYAALVRLAETAPDFTAAMDKFRRDPSAASGLIYTLAERERTFREAADGFNEFASSDSIGSQVVEASQLAFRILADGSATVHRMLVDIMNGNYKLQPGTQADSLAVVGQRRDAATRLLIVAPALIQHTLITQSKRGGNFDALKLSGAERDTLARFLRSSFPALKPEGHVSTDLRYGPQILLKMMVDTSCRSRPP